MIDSKLIKVPLISEMAAENKKPEYLFWVGSLSSYNARIQRVSRDFAKILTYCEVDFAILGIEETDSGDIARRAGNEFLFQMQALNNIQTFEMYQINKIITCCPHDYNTFKNEYPDLGVNYEVYHHTEFLWMLIQSGKLQIDHSLIQGKKITYHDPCYLGRGNSMYGYPRSILKKISTQFLELKYTKERAICCGAGGTQIFRGTNNSIQYLNQLRKLDIEESGAEMLATACPFCLSVFSEYFEEKIQVFDLAELIVLAIGI